MRHRRKAGQCPLVGKAHPQHNPLGDGFGLTQGTCACGAFAQFVCKNGVLVPGDHKKHRR